MFKKIFLTIGTAVFASLVATAGTAEPLNYKLILGLADRDAVEVGQDVESLKARDLPFHFALEMASSPEQVRTLWRDLPGAGLGRADFGTREGELAEVVTFSVLALPEKEGQPQFQYVFDALVYRVFPTLLAPEEAQFYGGKLRYVAGQPAVEFIASFDMPGKGHVAARLIGIFPPRGDEVLVAVQQTVLDKMPIDEPADLNRTFAGAMLESITFTAWRDQAGELRRF